MKNETCIDLWEELSNELRDREKDFKKFYINQVKSDPRLKKCWQFCFDKNREQDEDNYYKKWLPLIRKDHISKADFSRINKMQSSAISSDRIFYDALKLLSFVTAKAILHKYRAEEAGHIIPLRELIEAHSVFYRCEIANGYKEINYFNIPDFIEEHTRTSNERGHIKEDICLIFFIPPNFQYLQNYFENYTVELFQESPLSRDITYGSASFVPVKDDNQGFIEDPHRQYTISIEFMGNRQKLMDCSLREKYKPLRIEQAGAMKRILRELPYYEDEKDLWDESQRIIERKFFELINAFDEKKHGYLAGYLNRRLEFFCVNHSRKESAKKRNPKKGFTDIQYFDKDTEEYKIVTDEIPLNKQFPDLDLVLSRVIEPDISLENNQEQQRHEIIYQKIRNDLSPAPKKFIEIMKDNPDKKGKELADLAGISVAMVKKNIRDIRKVAGKYKKDL